MADNQPEISITIKTGKQTKDPSKEWKGILVTIGEYSHLYFPQSRFEMEYIEKVLNGEQ